MLSLQIHDVIAATGATLAAHSQPSAERVGELPVVVAFTAGLADEVSEIKRFLGQNLYRHPQVMRTTEQARHVVAALFEAYFSQPSLLSGAATAEETSARTIADYLAGMTDRLAVREYERLTGQAAFD